MTFLGNDLRPPIMQAVISLIVVATAICGAKRIATPQLNRALVETVPTPVEQEDDRESESQLDEFCAEIRRHRRVTSDGKAQAAAGIKAITVGCQHLDRLLAGNRGHRYANGLCAPLVC